MIRYHGTPITPAVVARDCLRGRHAMVSFAAQQQIDLVVETCQSFALDNGAFTVWNKGGTLDFAGYCEFVREWCLHPGFDWALIPDAIDGDELANDVMLAKWREAGLWQYGVPVWHLHESLDRLKTLAHAFPRIAFGSSGEYRTPGKRRWRERMDDAFEAICDEQGRPRTKVHGLRMMAPTIFSRYPFASVDSTNVARNIGIDKFWDSFAYGRKTKRSTRAIVIRDNCENHTCATVFVRRMSRQNRLLFG